MIVGLAGTVPALSRLLPPGALRARRGLPTAVLLKGILTFAFFGTDAYISLAVTSVRHRSVTLAGLALTAATLTWTGGAWINARRATNTPPRRLIAVGMTLIAIGIVAMTAGLNRATPLATIVIAWAVAGLGMGLAYQSVTLAVLAEAPPGQEGGAARRSSWPSSLASRRGRASSARWSRSAPGWDGRARWRCALGSLSRSLPRYSASP